MLPIFWLYSLARDPVPVARIVGGALARAVLIALPFTVLQLATRKPRRRGMPWPTVPQNRVTRGERRARAARSLLA